MATSSARDPLTPPNYTDKKTGTMQIKAWLTILLEPDSTFEIRIPKLARGGTGVYGFFRANSSGLLSAAKMCLDQSTELVPAVYVTLNPVASDLPTTGNTGRLVRLEKNAGTKKSSIVYRRWLFFDLDAIRKKDRSSTDAERAAVRTTAHAIRDYLTARGWSAPILADSGNGYHLLYRIDIPVDDDGLVKLCVQAIDTMFSSLAVQVDTAVHDAPRVIKVPGTWARKGEHTLERPHRLSAMVDVPEVLEVIPREKLQELATDGIAAAAAVSTIVVTAEEIQEASEQTTAGMATARNGKPIDKVRRARNYLAAVPPAVSGQGGHKHTFETAIKVCLGFDLTISEAIEAFSDWNAKCDPPWSDSELTHKLTDAIEKGTGPRGRLLRDSMSADMVGDIAFSPESAASGTLAGSSLPTNKKVRRPSVLLDHQEFRAVNEAMKILFASDKNVYVRGGMLVDVIEPKKEGDQPHMVNLCDASLRTKLTKYMDFKRVQSTKEGDIEHDINPTEWLVKGVLREHRWPGARDLKAIVETPIMRSDGTILQTPGYDEKSGLLYSPSLGGEFPPIPESATIDDAKAAASRLLDLTCDFPFKHPAYRSAWLAAVLSPLARFSYQGPTPFFFVDGNVRSAGKGKLINLASIISTGREFAVKTYMHDPDEMAKTITSIAISGERMVLFDNIKNAVGNPSFDAALTATEWSARILGTSHSPRHSLLICWYGTGNNVTITDDLARRMCPIKIESEEINPEDRSAYRYRLPLHAIDNWRSYLADALTILVAFHRAGRPQTINKSWGSFEGWSDFVRQSISWLGLPDPDTRHIDTDTPPDADTQFLRLLIAGWEEVAGRDAMSAKEAIEYYRKTNLLGDDYSTFEEAMSEIPGARAKGSDNMPSPKQLGCTLRRYARRWMGYPGHWDSEKRLMFNLDRNGIAQWRVEYRPQKPQSAGYAGFTPTDDTPQTPQSKTSNDKDLQIIAGFAGFAGSHPNVQAHTHAHAHAHTHAHEAAGGEALINPANPAKMNNSNDSNNLRCGVYAQNDETANPAIPRIPRTDIAENTPCPRCSQLLRSRESFVCRDCGYDPSTTQPETPQ